MLGQLLNMFIVMCLFNHPVNSVQRWNEHGHGMIEDLIIDNDETVAENLVLHLISEIIIENGTSCGVICLYKTTVDHQEVKALVKSILQTLSH